MSFKAISFNNWLRYISLQKIKFEFVLAQGISPILAFTIAGHVGCGNDWCGTRLRAAALSTR
jgi:hypothetical protein